MSRSGKYVTQTSGYKTFVPSPLPPHPAIKMDGPLSELHNEAMVILARLDGMAYTLPNTDLFIMMYLKKEALLSAQIEGTQASLENVFEFEQGSIPQNMNDVREVANYIAALNYGMKRMKKIPMSVRLIRELHALILKGVRGENKYPGEFKQLQNWIGSAGTPISQASFVPPTPQDTITAMTELEKYMHGKNEVPHLIRCALIHYQFETIHPFLDGNGRLGRLLITFYLSWKKVVTKPLLYLSYYFKKHRQEYYDRLNMVRNKGDYEQWITFFLEGVIETANSALSHTKQILDLQATHKKMLWKKKVSSPLAVMVHEKLFYTPVISVSDVQSEFGITYQAASNLVNQFDEIGILREITGRKRDMRFVYSDYLTILSEGTKPL